MEALIARSVQILIALGGAYVLTLWFALVVWTFQDIQARSRSVVAQIFSTLVVMIFSIPGLLVYLILRPRYTLDDAFQRSLEEEYLMQDLEELPLCPGCQQYVEDEWVFCPNCRTELRDNCIACDRLIDLRWEICPYCGTEQYADEDILPVPAAQPVITPSPQYLGRPQLSPAEVFSLTTSQERTRPIIPATVRVDLRNGSVATEAAPELPVSPPLRTLGSLGAPRRVTLDGGNGSSDLVGGHYEPNDEPQELEHSEPEDLSVQPDPVYAEQVMVDVTDTESAPVAEEPESELSQTSAVQEDEGPQPPSKRTRKRRSRKRKSDAAEQSPSTDEVQH